MGILERLRRATWALLIASLIVAPVFVLSASAHLLWSFGRSPASLGDAFDIVLEVIGAIDFGLAGLLLQFSLIYAALSFAASLAFAYVGVLVVRTQSRLANVAFLAVAATVISFLFFGVEFERIPDKRPNVDTTTIWRLARGATDTAYFAVLGLVFALVYEWRGGRRKHTSRAI